MLKKVPRVKAISALIGRLPLIISLTVERGMPVRRESSL